MEISDTGKGIGADQLEALFEPGLRQDVDGVKAGLGLFVSNKIIRKHGGEIRVQSTLGTGSKFTVVLPVESGRLSPRWRRR